LEFGGHKKDAMLHANN